jgi:hypothetical protein
MKNFSPYVFFKQSFHQSLGFLFKVDKDKWPVLYAAENKKVMAMHTIDRNEGLDETTYRFFNTENPVGPMRIDCHHAFYGRL